MHTDIINGKYHSNPIIPFRLILFLILFVTLPGINEIRGQGKTWVIVIDPGHGGKDPGALGSFAKEKNINLAIALKAGEYLEKNLSNVKVLYTRKDDVFVGLIERADFANKNKADLFISVHANSIAKKTIQGTETWIMGPARDEQNLAVAMKENEVIQWEDDFTTKYEGFDPKSPESYIMFTVMQNTFKEQSTWLASDIQNQFRNRAGRNDLGVKQAGFLVLYMTTMPSVLIETGFLTNPEEEKFLTSKTGQDYIASAIFRACRSYINEIEKKTIVSQDMKLIEIQPADTAKEQTVDNISDPVTFSVQIASSTKRIEIIPDNFKGLGDIKEIFIDNRYKYATGSFFDYKETVEYWKKIRAIIPDAFVIALQGDKILPLEDAKRLTQQK
ncbi:MAG TPA: N-acetylmuramoyl-L-alanine amidase [Bacteroidales bacterium]|nr:N-acetylmuramoyl-L-alanine amidase [Bacteroidales bacterium]HNR42136.1 N-acetylmuramoyl-L-alanine amidase [Bacteroidales bacterium]HQG77517.1 N-acetylmuramoyl-L-alanine amidase [Bacteroidales bacterium]